VVLSVVLRTWSRCGIKWCPSVRVSKCPSVFMFAPCICVCGLMVAETGSVGQRAPRLLASQLVAPGCILPVHHLRHQQHHHDHHPLPFPLKTPPSAPPTRSFNFVRQCDDAGQNNLTMWQQLW